MKRILILLTFTSAYAFAWDCNTSCVYDTCMRYTGLSRCNLEAIPAYKDCMTKKMFSCGVRAASGVFYGNYCGKGNKGRDKQPIDALDAACARHDACYDNMKYPGNNPKGVCDKNLARDALQIYLYETDLDDGVREKAYFTSRYFGPKILWSPIKVFGIISTMPPFQK